MWITAGFSTLVGNVVKNPKVANATALNAVKHNEYLTPEEIGEIMVANGRGEELARLAGVENPTAEDVAKIEEEVKNMASMYKEADAIMITGSAGGIISGEVDVIIDLKSKVPNSERIYIAGGANGGISAESFSASIVAVKIVPKKSKGKVADDVRKKAFSGKSKLFGGYLGVGGGAVLSEDPEVADEYNIYVVGLGTIQVGMGKTHSESGKTLIEYRKEQISEEIKENPYGTD